MIAIDLKQEPCAYDRPYRRVTVLGQPPAWQYKVNERVKEVQAHKVAEVKVARLLAV